MKFHYFLAAGMLSALASNVQAGNPISYTDWTTASSPGPNGFVGGTLSLSTGTVDVSYSGEFAVVNINNGIAPYYYWVQPNSASLPYTGNSVVGNLPSTTDIIGLSEPNGVETDTITFSKPVFDPIMLINSLGGGGPDPTVSYVFNQPFTLLSAGVGSFGGSATSLTASGNTLTGTEGNGAIEFLGDVTSISWQTGGQYGNEFWNGITIGAETSQPSNGVPDAASTLGLLSASLAGLLGLARKK